MKIKLAEVWRLTMTVLKKHGYDQDESETILNSLLWAQKRGSSQGLLKLFGWRVERRKEAQKPQLEKLEGNHLLVDACLNNHVVACDFALQRILPLMVGKTIFVAGVKNTYNSAGALGYYTERFAKAGYVAIMMSAADPGVVAYGGQTPVFGTNPISIAVPGVADPILLDMSTAALTWGDLVKFESESKPLPSGVAFDAGGNATTDAKAAMEGWVTTFDKSYKGSGLALMIQILAGPLVGSIYSKNYRECQYGSLMIVINPESFGNKQLFTSQVQKMVEEVKGSAKAPGFDEVLMPGEKGYRNAKSGGDEEIEVSEELLAKINGFIKD